MKQTERERKTKREIEKEKKSDRDRGRERERVIEKPNQVNQASCEQSCTVADNL